MKLKEVSEKLYSKLEEREVEGQKKYYRLLEVHPWIDKEGKINWKNLLIGGSPKRLIFPLIFLAIICLAIYEYYTNFQNCQAAIQYYNFYKDPLSNITQNFSNLNLTGLVHYIK